MSKGLFFWIVYIVLFILCLALPVSRPYWIFTVALFVLIGVIGWAVFGAAVH